MKKFHVINFLFIISVSLFKSQQYSQKQIDSLLNNISLINRDWDLNKNVTFFNTIYKASENINYEKGKIISLLLTCEIYLQKGQYDKALEYTEQIENMPIKVANNYYYKIGALEDKAYSYSMLGFYKDAENSLNQSYQLSSKLKGDIRLQARGEFFSFKGQLRKEMDKPIDSVLKYQKYAISQYKKIQKEKVREALLKLEYQNISESFLEAKKTDSALSYLYKIMKFQSLNDLETVQFFQMIGRAYDQKAQPDSALFYYKRAAAEAKKIQDPFSMKESYQVLSEFYEKMGDKENSLLYSKKYSKLIDSISLAEKKSLNKASEVIKKDISEKANETKRKLYLIIAVIFLILCIIAYFLFRYSKNYRRERDERILTDERIYEKEEELKKIKNKVNDEILLLAKDNSPEFVNRFRELYPLFYKNLLETYPDINNDTIKFCTLLKLNFSTKEIAAYTAVTPRAVQIRKNRLRKKLNIPSNEDINVWMDRLG